MRTTMLRAVIALAAAVVLGGCDAFRPGMPDVGALDADAMSRAPGGAMEEFNPEGAPPVEYAAPVAVVRISRPDWPHESSGSPDCRYDIVVEGYVRGRSVSGVDAWHLAHDGEFFKLGTDYGSHYSTTLRTYPCPPRGPDIVCILYAAPCADLPVPGSVELPRSPAEVPVWSRRRWAYPIVTDRPITDAKVYVHADGVEVRAGGRWGPTLVITPREVPVIEQSALAGPPAH